jgi:tetratricopeptide (TPR) repeat protein
MSNAGPTSIDMRELLREVQQESSHESSHPDEITEVSIENEIIPENAIEEPKEAPPHAVSNDTAELLDEGESLARQGSVTDALAAFNRAIALDPNCDMAWFNRGVLLEGNGDTVGARQSFAITLDLNRNNGPAAANLAILLDRIGEIDEAAEWANIALHTYPGHATLLDVLIRAGVTPTTPVPAPLVDDEVISDSQDEVISPSMEPVSTTRIEESVDSGISAVDLDDIVEQATLMLRSGDSAGAMELASRHLQGEGSSHPGIWRVVAGCKGKTGDVDGAIEAYNKALGIDNADAKCWYNLGVLHRRSSRIDHALTCFSTALNLDAGYTKAADSLRQLALDSGKVDIAITAWEKLLVLEPTHSSRIEFVRLLVDIGNGEAFMLDVAQKSTLTLPEGPQLALLALRFITDADDEAELKALATSLSGDQFSAVAQWKEMLQRDAENGSYWLGLAAALEAAGDLDTATKCREKARSFGIGDAQIELANSSLAQPEAPVNSEHSTEIPLPSSQTQLPDSTPAVESEVGELSTAEPASEPQISVSPSSMPAASGEAPWRWSDNVVAEVLAEYHLDDRDELISVAKNHDDGNRYLKREELQSAAELLKNSKKTWRYSDNVVAEIMEGYGLDDSAALIEAAKLHDDGNRYLTRQEFMSAARELMMAKQPAIDENIVISNVAEAAPHVAAESVRTMVEPPLPSESEADTTIDEPEILLTPVTPTPSKITNTTEIVPNVDLSAAAQEATILVESAREEYQSSSASVDSDIEWYNRGLSLISENKYRESLSCLDKALNIFKDENDNEMVIRILNARGNAFYYLEDYPKTIENYHQAMLINPALVSGRTLYNMGTAYAEMERYDDAIKCYEQAIPRGLSDEEVSLAKEQSRRCVQLRKESLKRAL